MPSDPTDAPGGESLRPHSRRHAPRSYAVERRPVAHPRLPLVQPGDPASDAIELMGAAGSLQSALRRATRAARLDWRLARLVLILRPGYPMRVSDIAWQLGLTTGAASNLCDAAEQRTLLDKLYAAPDRRATDVILTSAPPRVRAPLLPRDPSRLRRPVAPRGCPAP